jgi:1-acyl-sn-glycerol-3-phosphate acyltransferase
MTPGGRGATWFLRAGARVIAARRLDLRVEGWEHLPRRGPLLIASRHYHHLYDGCLLLGVVPRPLHLLVALDWVARRRDRRLMEWACRTAQWPVVLRTERLHAGNSAYGPTDAGRYLRHAVHDAVALLRAGRALAVFPEAYPTVDPHATPKASGDAFLPFRPGFIRLVEMAQRDGRTCVPIVPAGLVYRPGPRWEATLRFTAPLYVAGRADRAAVVRLVEEQVRLLSTPGSVWPHADVSETSAVGDE